MNAGLRPGARRSISHIAHFQRIDEHVEGTDSLTGARPSSHSAIVSGNATYWDPCRLYRRRAVLPTLQQAREGRRDRRRPHGVPVSRGLVARCRLCIGDLLCTIALAGCTVGPNFVKPKSGLDAAVLSPRQDRPGTVPTSDATVPAQWWSLFHDPVLSGLEQQAQADNLGLQMAFERIEASRAVLGITSSQLLPSVAAGASYARSALSKNGKFAALGAPTRPTNFWQLGFDFSWEIDLWGRARRAREGAAAALEATEYDREAVRVALTAAVASTYLKLRGTQAQLDIAQQNLDIARHVLDLVQSRVRNGVATDFETASARAQLAEVQ